MTTLFDPVRLGDLTLPNRIVMAPLTRNRAGAGQVPTPLMVEYYRQRAKPATGAGLIIAEATQISAMGQGYLDTPGIHTPQQIAGWRAVTDAVHAAGGRIVLQLWHVGRISHVSLLPGNAQPLAPSAIRARAQTYVASGFVDVSEPRALALEELPGIVESYRVAARNAIAAGFDGVEVHAANGYLLDQFLRDGTNQRTDAYGGSIENRARLLLEVMQAVSQEVGAIRAGVRLSPVSPFNDMADSDPQPLFNHVVEQLSTLGLMYCHVIEGSTGGPRDAVPFDWDALRRRFRGAWMVNNGYDRALADEKLASGQADLVAFGKPFISNPDYGRRLREGAPLNPLRPELMYGGSAEGYTDYPALD